MSDLTDEDLRRLSVSGGWMQNAAAEATLTSESQRAIGHRIMRAVEELQRHRARLAADRERVPQVVSDSVFLVLANPDTPDLPVLASYQIADAIAARVADQLCTNTPAQVAATTTTLASRVHASHAAMDRADSELFDAVTKACGEVAWAEESEWRTDQYDNSIEVCGIGEIDLDAAAARLKALGFSRVWLHQHPPPFGTCKCPCR